MEFIFQFFAQLFSESELLGSVDNEQQDVVADEIGECEVIDNDSPINIFEMINFH
ncbi:MAG: hypothetical protein HUJ96_09435 [Marinilabiliaceae bacterium]|nr:hypothetical protein [Marinilabiliaceae bacterium]